MAEFNFDVTGLDELREAVKRNPAKIIEEVGKFLQRGMAEYRRVIRNNPWRMGEEGGGVPRATGNLMDTHLQEFTTWSARIFPTAPYASYVHGIDGWPRKGSYQLRPWLSYAYNVADKAVQELENDLLKNIVDDLAK